MSMNAGPVKVCISGFLQDEKESLKKLAIDSGLIPVGAVSKSLGYLVAGPDCSGRARACAAGFGVAVVTRDEFETLLIGRETDTGEAGTRQPSLIPGQKLSMPPGVFVAVNFETADRFRDSACAVSLMRIENGAATAEAYSLIRPPRADIEFAHIHGLAWDDLANEKPFADVWRSVRRVCDGADCFIAHNAAFHKSVLATCCEAAAVEPPSMPFVCTLRGAKKAIAGADSYSLSTMCEAYGIPLNRHGAMSDAKAAALLFSALCGRGVSPDAVRVPGITPVPKDGRKQAIDPALRPALKEFLKISRTVVGDGVLAEDEMAWVLEWLDENAGLENSPHFSPIFEFAWSMIEDDVMTEEELDEMKTVLEWWNANIGARG